MTQAKDLDIADIGKIVKFETKVVHFDGGRYGVDAIVFGPLDSVEIRKETVTLVVSGRGHSVDLDSEVTVASALQPITTIINNNKDKTEAVAAQIKKLLDFEFKDKKTEDK